MLLTIFRLLNLLLLGNGLYKSITTKLPPHLVKSGQFQFITNCSLLITVVYLSLLLLRYQSICIYNLASNLEFNVIVSYWTMALLFPQMVAEDDVDRDLFMDLQVHAFPYLYLIIDSSQQNISLAASTVITASFIVGYWLYIETECGKHVGDGVSGYPYPFMKGKSQRERFFYVSIFGVIACCNWFVLKIRNVI